MYIRNTTLSMNNSMLASLTKSQNSYLDALLKASSKTAVSKPSDDPVAASNILKIQTQQNKIETYYSNIATANEQINMMDSSLAETIDDLQRAYELAQQGSNGTYNADQYQAMKAEVDQIIASIADFANTQYSGQYIYSGNNISTPAYTIADDGSVQYNGTTGQADSQRTVEIMEGVELPLNVVGCDIFGWYKAGTDEVLDDPATPADEYQAAVPATGEGLFKALADLSSALDEGDESKVSQTIAGVKDAISTVNNVRTKYGAYSSQRLEMTKSYLDDLSLSLTEQRSNSEDLDMVSTFTNLSNQYYSYQASMSVTSKALSISLLDYM